MGDLTIPRNYNDAEVLSEQDLDDAFDAIETKANTSKWDADNIADSAISTAKLENLAVTAGKLATDAVTTAKILDSNITTAKINDDAVTSAKLGDNLTLPGTATINSGTLQVGSAGPVLTGTAANLDIGASVVTFGSANYAKLSPTTAATKLGIRKGGTSTDRMIVVSHEPATAGLLIVRGEVTGLGALSAGEGFTCSRSGAGTYTVTFTASTFTAAPVVVATAQTAGYAVNIESLNTGNFSVRTFTGASTLDTTWGFIAIGQRSA